MFKVLIASVLALTLVACKKDDRGQHLGNFKNACIADKGKLEEISPNNYKCTLPDGAVRVSN